MKREFSVLSSDNVHRLIGVIYLPEGEPKALFHIVHGMSEHIGRYDRIMSDMARAGYICFGYDNLGHGKTARDESELGFIAKKGGDELMCRDVKIFSDAVIAEFDREKRLPYYLMGHSMGSFITRLAVEKYVKPDKYIIMGTGGNNPAAGIGLAVIAVIKAIFGEKHISSFIEKLAFGSYNKPFGGSSAEEPVPWLTKDRAVQKKYCMDPFCSKKFSVSAMGDLIRLNKDSNRRDWFCNMPKDIPILLLSGENDPVGDFGKGVRQVHEGLIENGVHAECNLYKNARHEILNDDTYESVKEDIIEFLEA